MTDKDSGSCSVSWRNPGKGVERTLSMVVKRFILFESRKGS